MRIRTGIHPGDWTENEPAVGRFHGTAAWGTRGSMVIAGTNRPVPNVIRANLRTPETGSSKAARLRREQKQCCKWLPIVGEHCARLSGHAGKHASRGALDVGNALQRDRRHAAPLEQRPVCGMFMAKVGEYCARWEGHRHQHKSRFALDNMAVSKREGRVE